MGERNVAAWSASQLKGGSPGSFDSIRPEPLRGVVINELLANTDDPELDFLELYNHSNFLADLSGAVLTDDLNTNKFVLPPGTIISPRGFLSLTQTDLGFALSSAGETVYFINPNQTRVGRRSLLVPKPWGFDRDFRMAARFSGIAVSHTRRAKRGFDSRHCHQRNHTTPSRMILMTSSSNSTTRAPMRLILAIGASMPGSTSLCPDT
jgi:hypothetical protein